MEEESVRYYCDKHFRARKYAMDNEYERMEYEQWGDKEWYRKAMWRVVRKYEKPTQLGLF